MGIYLKKFENHTLYDSYINSSDAILPNVSICTTEEDVHYNSWVETMVVVKYNVTDTSSPTSLRTSYEQNIFKSMEIDGVMLDELVTEYTFNTTGEHIVKYELYDETKLGNSAPVFFNSNLVECIIPDSVTYIGSNAFLGCGGLTSITIGSSVTYIGGGALANTMALKVLNYNAKWGLSSSLNNNWPNLETVIIGNSTPYIDSQTFIGSNKLTSVTIGNGVTSIGTEAFAHCPNLTNITIGSGVTHINTGAFTDCNSLISIVIPNNVETIDSNIFANCKGLTSITINNSVIGGYAFSGCSSLTSVTLSNSLTQIGEYAFKDCTDLTSIDIPNSVTYIGASAFSGCSGLTSIDIPSGVTSIGQYVFNDCTSLTSVTLSNSLTQIGANAFEDCSGLTNITSYAITAPYVYNTTFVNIKTGGTLTVSSGSTGYDKWMSTDDYFLGSYSWTKVEQ